MTQSLQLAQATNVQTSSLIAHLPTKNSVQKGLLGLSVVTSVFSVIPAFRLAGSLATRSIVLLSNTLECIKNPNTKQHWTDRFAKYSKVAIVAIGIAGLAAAAPALLVASLAADLGLQTIETIKAGYQKDQSKVIFHFTMRVIDGLVLSAVLSGSWVMIVTAASVNALVMGCLAVKSACRVIKNRDSWSDAIEPIGYFALFLLGIATAITSARFTAKVKGNSVFKVDNNDNATPKYSVFKVDNHDNATLTFYDKTGKLVATINPGESATFKVPFEDTYKHIGNHVVPNVKEGAGSVLEIQESFVFGQARSAFPNGEVWYKYSKLDAASIASIDVVTQQPLAKDVVTQLPLAVEHFTKLPLGGTATVIVSEESN